MNRILKYILIIAGVLLCMSYAVIANTKSNETDEEKVCNRINITITDINHKQLISNKEIEVLLRNNQLHPIGKSLRNIVSKDIEDVIAKHPMVREVECYKSPTGEVQVVIEQRTPMLRVMGEENYYVDELGKTMPVSLNFSAYVPVATGRVTKKMATNELFEFAYFIHKHPFWNDQIDQININEKMEVELIPRVGNHLIYLGKFDRYEQKLEKLKKFYLYGMNEFGWNIYSKIDLRFKDQVVCTKK